MNILKKTTNMLDRMRSMIHGNIKLMVFGALGSGKSSLLNLIYTHCCWDGDDETLIPLINHFASRESAEHVTTENKIAKLRLESTMLIDSPGLDFDEKDEVKFENLARNIIEHKISGIVFVGNDRRFTQSLKKILHDLCKTMCSDLPFLLFVQTNKCDPCVYENDIKEVVKENLIVVKSIDNRINCADVCNDVTKIKEELERHSNFVEQLLAACKLANLYSLDWRDIYASRQENMVRELANIFQSSMNEINELILSDKIIRNQSPEFMKLQNQVPKEYWSTMCAQCDIKAPCHTRCTLTYTTIKGNKIFKDCYAMTDSWIFWKKCGVCQHDWSLHYHSNNTWSEDKTRKEFLSVKSNALKKLEGIGETMNKIRHSISDFYMRFEYFMNSHQRRTLNDKLDQLIMQVLPAPSEARTVVGEIVMNYKKKS